jgi:hypothetical protein
MVKKIDPLNRKQYGAVSAALTLSDIPAAVSFYENALGFSKRSVMNGLELGEIFLPCSHKLCPASARHSWEIQS